jgi:3-dehydroquinate synthase
MTAPGAYRRCRDRWGAFERCAATLAPGALCLVDARVAALHPKVLRALSKRQPAAVLTLRATERLKSAEQLVRIARDAPAVCTRVVVVGGGTLGDLGTVLAHLVRRGVPLTHVPTTLLAAVDSSVGGKGAVHARGIKNAWGVFHYPDEAWLCPELWKTLSAQQLRQGEIEAFKMALCLERRAWRSAPPLKDLVRRARALKGRVCAEDPYDQGGVRRVLNFGHTVGHAIESLTRFRVAHGDAVALGMLCALDLGRTLQVTPAEVAELAERRLPDRRDLQRVLRARSSQQLAALIAADKKGASLHHASFVLLERQGRARVHRVERGAWERLLPSWQQGARP